jgi:hypothetical protein
MSKRLVLVALLVAVAFPMRADFDAVVHAIESHRDLHRVRIPFIGLARFCVWIVHPKGVHDFQLATFEGDASNIDGRSIGELLVRNAGKGFRPLVRAYSKRGRGEWTYIYARPAGDAFELMIATHDSSDTTVVRAVVDLERLQQAINDGQHGRVRIVASMQ